MDQSQCDCQDECDMEHFCLADACEIVDPYEQRRQEHRPATRSSRAKWFIYRFRSAGCSYEL